VLRDDEGHLPDGLVRLVSRLHAALLRASRGRLGRRLVDNDMLLLTTRGHRSGGRHAVPLLYLREGASLVVIASYGGRHHHPDWYRNLLADPEAEAQVGGTRVPVRARPAHGRERRRLWERATAAYPGYARYQARTDREIPVVVLEPR
jgi:deazaflavin-dependent oxidoreductase (nitroreductase family)